MAFLHLKNLGKTFNGKVGFLRVVCWIGGKSCVRASNVPEIQPVHARIKDGGPPEANSNRMTPLPSTQGHVMFVSPEGPNRIMTTSTGHIVVHELPWEGGNHAMNPSHRSRSNTFTAAEAAEGLGVNGEIGEVSSCPVEDSNSPRSVVLLSHPHPGTETTGIRTQGCFPTFVGCWFRLLVS